MQQWLEVHNDDDLCLNITVAVLEVGDGPMGKQWPAHTIARATWFLELFVDPSLTPDVSQVIYTNAGHQKRFWGHPGAQGATHQSLQCPC